MADFARVLPADRAELSALLGFDNLPRNERRLLVDIAVRWAVVLELQRPLPLTTTGSPASENSLPRP